MSSTQPTADTECLVSQLLAEDEDLREIVEEFVAGLPTRVAELEEAYSKLEWEMLATLWHRLKGAAGSYGYPVISQLCADHEQQARAKSSEGLEDALDQLRAYAAAAAKGLNES